MRAAIYARISKARRDEDGPETLGVDRQVDRCKALAERLGATVEHVYIDNDKSGKAGVVRPEYEAMKLAVASDELDLVLCYKTDRLSRDRVALQLLYELFKKHDTKLHTDTEGAITLDTADGALMAGIRAELAQYERAVISMRVKAQKEQAAKQGRVLGSRFRLYGYADKHRTALNEAEAKEIRDMATAFLEGHTLYALAMRLNRKGSTTVAGGTWRARDIRRVLTNPAYVGDRVLNGEVVAKGDWPTILDKLTFDRIVSKVEANQRGPYKAHRKYLLSGILYCTKCNHRMGGGIVNQKPVYRCLMADGGCGRVSRIAEPLDKAILDLTVMLIRTLPIYPKHVDMSAIERIDSDLALLAQARKDGRIDMTTFLDQNEDLQRERKKLTAELETATKLSSMSGRDAEFRRAPVEEQRETIRKWFPSIGVVPAGRGKRAKNFSIADELVFERPLKEYFVKAEKGE